MQNILDLQTIETTEDTNQTEQPWSLISLFICK
ncbi:MAG TPA: class III lanthipeptide [Candidatus Rothia avicola]|uniref:Class III lanthipeptide n=1 Tax=Candidatus Rothia avicola TaxID=2840478 RepID=A0A9D2CPU6_9MICC|nr:class III lanthipeptide [Candidatus Rothia avicola]HIY94395.1 class III lanthipeptide [Candidatus Rothia avicola]